MKMAKRLICLTLCLVLALSLCACGGGEDTSTPSAVTSDVSATGESQGTTSTSAQDTSTTITSAQDTSTTGSSAGDTPTQAGTSMGQTSNSKTSIITNTTKTTKTSVATTTTKPRTKVKVAVSKTIPAITSEGDAQLLKNPNRGWRSIIIDEANISTIAGQGTFEKMVTYCEKLLDSRAIPTSDPECTVVMSYLWLSGYCDRDISAKGLLAVEAYFQAILNKGLQAIASFQYSDKYPDELDDAEQKIMHRHIDQLAPIVKKWSRAIHTVRVAFAGAYGEWVEPYFPIDYTALLEKVMTTMVPDELYAQVRLPRFKNYVAGKPYYNKIGMHIDSFFGKKSATDYGFGGCEEQDATKAYWDQLKKEAAYAPNDGELFVQEYFNSTNSTVTAQEAILELSEHRFTTLSARNAYGQLGDRDSSVVGSWKKWNITEQWCKENNIIYAPGWFKNASGKTVARNGQDFVRDYLGYKVELRDLKVTGDSKPSAKINCSLSLVNYGFSAAFNMQSGFAILDENNKVVGSVKVGSPEKWYSRNPDNYEDGKLLTHTLSTSVTLPSKSGHYKLAFYLKNSADQFAKTGNKTDYAGGYQILHEFDI